MSPRGWMALAGRLGLALVFIAAALPKIADPKAFVESIENYQIAMASPWHFYVVPLGLILPWLEAWCGVALIISSLGEWRAKDGAPWRPVSRACLWLFLGMLVVFMLALASADIRGLDISCGCFGHEEPGLGSARKAFIRDIGFLFLLFLGWKPLRKAP